MDLQTNVALTAAGATLLVGAAGTVVLPQIAKRSVTLSTIAAPLAVVASVAVGVWAGVQAMLLEGSALSLLLVVLACASAVALGMGVVTAVRVSQEERQRMDAANNAAKEREVEESRREMITWISHDLRTPLAGIKAMSEAIRDGVTTSGDEYLNRISNEADRTTAMVDDLLALTRLNASTETAQRDQLSVGDLISDTLAAAAPMAAERGISINGKVATDGFFVADVRHLERALLNVVTNAVAYSPEASTITVTGEVSDDSVCLKVADQCGGIDREHMEHLFEPGYRASSARTPGVAGAGLGLAIVEAIVKSHGGRVRLTNADGGCVCTLAIPTS